MKRILDKILYKQMMLRLFYSIIGFKTWCSLFASLVLKTFVIVPPGKIKYLNLKQEVGISIPKIGNNISKNVSTVLWVWIARTVEQLTSTFLFKILCLWIELRYQYDVFFGWNRSDLVYRKSKQIAIITMEFLQNYIFF